MDGISLSGRLLASPTCAWQPRRLGGLPLALGTLRRRHVAIPLRGTIPLYMDKLVALAEMIRGLEQKAGGWLVVTFLRGSVLA